MTKTRHRCPMVAKFPDANARRPAWQARSGDLTSRFGVASRLLFNLTNVLGSRLPTSVGVLVAAVALVCGGGCLFTDPINVAPDVKIDTPLPIFRGDHIAFRAIVSDPNGDSVSVQWAVTRCPSDVDDDCLPCSEAPRWLPPGPVDYELSSAETDVPFCVWALATDAYGAFRQADPVPVRPRNHDPVPIIAVEGGKEPLPLYSGTKLTAWGSTDDDADDLATLSYVWSITAPAGSSAQLQDDAWPCHAARDGSEKCLLPDRDGLYTVELTVTDRHGGANKTTRIIEVAPDTLPCIVTIDPSISVLPRRFDQPVRLAVLKVDDDGDPYPHDEASPMRTNIAFRWYARRKGVEQRDYLGDSYASYSIPAKTYDFGDEVYVQVEVRDRDPRRSDDLFTACGDNSATCGQSASDLGGPGCYQRLSWTIRYNQ